MSEKKRFIDKREDRESVLELRTDDPHLVVCPKCEKMAKIFPVESDESYKIICLNCNYIKEQCISQLSYHPWMHTACCKERLSAVNRREIELLEGFVEAELREHLQDKYGYANTSYVSRLPKWIKSKKNRKEILDSLEKLRKMGKLEK
ncbi:MAG: hypothetical protein U9O24_00605 [Campylobacterota bacterium]|nr:hypothetical protein [Campylobacterota bacterium]